MDLITLAGKSKLPQCNGDIKFIRDPGSGQKDIAVQLVLSLALGLTSFLAFCLFRPRWKSLYAARKKQKDAASSLPELPDSFLGWMPVLYKVTEEELLASAGLDAYVFLSFFKMSIKFLGVTFLFAVAIIAPINGTFLGNWYGNDGDSDKTFFSAILTKPKEPNGEDEDTSYIWAYLVFTYFFAWLAFWFLLAETKKIIKIRQGYLGSQLTITDRTIKLSGIPKELRSDEKLKEILEKLEIGHVESVTICYNWKELDKLMDQRASILRKLEESWTVYQGQTGIQRSLETLPVVQPLPPSADVDADEDTQHSSEDATLLDSPALANGHIEKPRPLTRIWYGPLKLRSKKIDALDYYEEKLRNLDESIETARKKQYDTTPVAFVTLDSIAACQMAVQAVLDPKPSQLIASLAPSPSDIVWPNIYMPKVQRMIRSWSITAFILFLSVIWLVPVASLASLLNLCSIEKAFPDMAAFLSKHKIVQSLVQTGLPTLVVSILNVAVPYLYDFLSNLQGFTSQSEVELSVISKNFFFTFFNFFLVFTVFEAATSVWGSLSDHFKDFKDNSEILLHLARQLNTLSAFYTNFILLQGVGLFPLRLLEFGSVSLYPILRMGAKTPRDFAELVQPPVFKYGFYLPTALLILILSVIYSILPAGFLILFFGLLYFVLGYFTYKYQLLYAMDHPQHATGGAWSMIAYRIIVGVGIFEFAMAGVMSLAKAFTPAILVLPLVISTVWFSYYFANTYDPLLKFIALRSISNEDDRDVNIADEELEDDHPELHLRRTSTTIDEAREKGLRFINPSLVVPLEPMWIDRDPDTSEPVPGLNHQSSGESALGLGERNVWRENGDTNV